MAKNIALEITLNGVQKSISSLQDFEKELQKLQDELGITTQESTKAFDTMSSEIQQVTQDFDKLTENIQDVNFEETVDQFTQVGDAITDTFGQAQTAIQEFGAETDIVGETAKKALNETSKASFSLSGSLKDMGDKFSQIPGPVGQLAQGITGLGTAFKILIANPVGIFLAGIALVFTTLYKALTSTEKGLFKFRELMGALQGVLDPVMKLLQSIAMVLVDGVLAGIEAVQKGLELLGFEKFAQASRDARDLAKAINEVEEAEGDLNVERAKQNKELAETREILSDTNISLAERRKALEEVRKSEENLASREVQLAEKRLANIREEIKQKGASLELNDREEQALIALFNTQQNQAAVRRKNIKADQALVREGEAEQKRLETEKAQRQKEIADKRKSQIEETKKLAIEGLTAELELQKQLRKEITVPIPEPAIITSLKSIRDNQKSLTEQFKKPTFKDLLDELKTVIPPYEQAADTVDNFGKMYESARKQLSKGAQGSREDFEIISKNLKNAFTDAFIKGNITKPALDAFKEIVEAYDVVNQNLNLAGDGGLFDAKKYYEVFKDFAIVNGVIIEEFNEDGVLVQAKTKKSYEKAVGDFEAFQMGMTENIKKFYRENDENVKKLVDIGATEEAKKLVEQLTQTYLENLKITSTSVIKSEQEIRKFYDNARKLQQERQKDETLSTLGFIANNTEIILKELIETVGLAEGVTEQAFRDLVMGIIGSKELTEDELNALSELYKKFYKQVDDERQKDVDKENEAAKKKREAQLNNIQALSQQLGEVSSTLSQFSDLALEKLAQDEQIALESIVGTNEEANQKRLELAQQYEGKRRQIEKQTRIQELEFARIQAVAEGAVAIIRSASTPILIPLTTALVAAQVALISAQIGQARSLQRGGMLQMGGLLEGPSHEQGGIRFGQMGLELEGGESVINRVSTAQYGSLLSTINQAGGGRPLVSSGFDDSRLLEALAKQRSEPIRAYVLEQEITNKQAVSSRLESLSTL
jgi:hypothetical protein